MCDDGAKNMFAIILDHLNFPLAYSTCTHASLPISSSVAIEVREILDELFKFQGIIHCNGKVVIVVQAYRAERNRGPQHGIVKCADRVIGYVVLKESRPIL